MGKVIIRDEKGNEKSISEQSWQLMRSGKEHGDTRKGYTLVGPDPGKKAPGSKGSPTAAPGRPDFKPDVIEERVKALADAERAKETEMMGGRVGAPPAPEQAAESASPAQPSVPVEAPAAVAEQVPPPAATEPAATVPPATEEKTAKADPLHAIEGVGIKVAEILASIGITTYKQLVAADIGAINKALDAGNMAPKKALVPSWKMKAKALVK